MTYAEIIEREFRNATQTSPIDIAFDETASTIDVTYMGNKFHCDCDSDTEFLFRCTTECCDDIRIPIPSDWINASRYDWTGI
jgi:hypothetical protein